MTRPFFEPTKEQRLTVSVMTACGVPQPSVCLAVINPSTKAPVDPKTLRRVFKAELAVAKQTANGQVAMSLFKRATGNGPQSVTAAIFWLKCQAGWREPTGPVGADDEPPPPVKVEVHVVDARRPGSADADAESTAG